MLLLWLIVHDVAVLVCYALAFLGKSVEYGSVQTQ